MQPPTHIPACLPDCPTAHYTAHPTSNELEVNERISLSLLRTNNVTHDETPTSIIQTEEGRRDGMTHHHHRRRRWNFSFGGKKILVVFSLISSCS